MSDDETAKALAEAHRQLEALERRLQVEAALDRVRACALAMRRSDELASVAAVMLREEQALGIESLRSGIGIVTEDEDKANVWTASTTAEGEDDLQLTFYIPLEGHPAVDGLHAAWKRQDDWYLLDLSGDDLAEYTQFMEDRLAGPFPEDPGFDASAMRRVVFHFFPFPEGAVSVITAEPLPEAVLHEVRRLADAFSFAYTRYLDLKQAEEQAREATRQASIDRIRAEIATMRTADDLGRITPLVWRELTTLGVPFFRCGVLIVDEAREDVEMFLSNSYGKQLAALQLSFAGHPFIQNAVTAWKNRQVFVDQWSRARLLTWVQFLLDQGHVAKAEDYMDREGPPSSLALHLVPFAQGLLYVGSADPLADDQIDLVQALADAFAVAYARYEDFKRLEAAKADVEATLDHLKTTQAQLIQSEKMASLGQLTAGIAHEIKNPLNFVNNFAELTQELTDELTQELQAYPPDNPVLETVQEILADIRLNCQKINEHGRRADGIVRAMMQHARGGERVRRETAVNALVEEYVNLAYHGMRASRPDFNVTIERAYDEGVGAVALVAQEMGRVLINLLNNAFYAVQEKQLTADLSYTPTISVGTQRIGAWVEIRIGDNGPGIGAGFREKIFEPFYTTKPAGEGTGLGLSLSYDIVTQGHGGTMTVESEEGKGATFVMTLPAG